MKFSQKENVKILSNAPLNFCKHGNLVDRPSPLRHVLHIFTSSLLFIFSPGAQTSMGPWDEAVMKIHKKMKIGIPEISTFSAITSKV